MPPHAIRALTAGLFALALAAPLAADAGATIDGKPKVSFFATGSPGFMSIEGATNTMTLEDDGTRLTFTVPMSTVSSGIDLRDEHMNENYVQIDKFPNAVLDLARADVTWPTAVGSTTAGVAAANFTVHGVTAPTAIAYTVNRTKTGYRVRAKFDFDCSAHGITIDPYMGISFDPKMNAVVSVDLLDAP